MILGISAFYHDAAAALVGPDGTLVAAAQEERFTRRKHDASFPRRAIAYCLAEAGITMADVELVAFYEKPWIKFERILESHVAYAPRGLRRFFLSMPVWVREKLWIERLIRRELAYDGRLVYPEHHESHAASAFYPSPFQRAAILTLDGVGEWATSTWGVGAGERLELEQELEFPNSLGLLYSAFTYYTGFRVNSGEYKLMGLAPYGQPTYRQAILDELLDLRPDGSFRLNMEYFDYGHGLRMTSPAFHRLFGGPPRAPESTIRTRDMDLARSIQEVTEEVILRMARHVRAATGETALCMAGGVALNSVANGKLVREGTFDRVWVQPAAGDAGGALGAALYAHHQVLERPRAAPAGSDGQRGSYLGPAYGPGEIGSWLEREGLPHRTPGHEAGAAEVARLLDDGQVVGFFSGRMEFGPRALGARSILADARDPEAQRTLNLKIKYRESFRPFAPACLAERAGEYFDLDVPSPYMLLVAPVREERRRPMPEGLEGLDRLPVERSDIPAVTHVDYSARVQTVDHDHPPFRAVIEAMDRQAGVPVVVNTSFNRRGEPIVCTPGDAYACFMGTEMDALFLEGHLLRKAEQPPAGAERLESLREDWVRYEPAPEPVSRRELRGFGLVMAVAITLVSALLVWRGHGWAVYLPAVAAPFALLALVAPGALAGVRAVWLRVGEALAGVTNRVLLALVFALAVVPTALAMRLAGRDRLGLRTDGEDSYWRPTGRRPGPEGYDRPY